MTGRGSEKDWIIRSMDGFCRRFVAVFLDLLFLGFNLAPRIIERFAWDEGAPCGFAPFEGGEKPLRLNRALLVLREPVLIESVAQQGTIGKPFPFMIPVRNLLSGGRCSASVYQKLRLVVGYHIAEIFFVLRGTGVAAEKAKDQIMDLFYGRGFDDPPVSIERALQDTRENFNEIAEGNYDIYRTNRINEAKVKNYKNDKPAFERNIKVRMDLVCLLTMAMNRAKEFEDGLNDLCTNNIRKGKIPSRERFIQCVFGVNYCQPDLDEALNIALHGQINPTLLWPTLGHLQDFFELAVFLGSRWLGHTYPPTCACGKTYASEIAGLLPYKKCDPLAIPNRQIYRDRIRTYVDKYIGPLVTASLCKAAGLPAEPSASIH